MGGGCCGCWGGAGCWGLPWVWGCCVEGAPPWAPAADDIRVISTTHTLMTTSHIYDTKRLWAPAADDIRVISITNTVVSTSHICDTHSYEHLRPMTYESYLWHTLLWLRVMSMTDQEIMSTSGPWRTSHIYDKHSYVSHMSTQCYVYMSVSHILMTSS